MLINLKEPLRKAVEDKRAVAAFNVYDPLTIRAALQSSSVLNKTVITAFGASYLKFLTFDEVAELTRFYSNLYKLDTVLHLDHCNDLDEIEKALKAGFTSVMFDGSRMTFDENLRLSREVVLMAREFNASTEAELGSIAVGIDSHEGEVTDKENYTNPDQAELFVKKTEVDALAVSIGTVHGMYKSEPDIRVDILKKIRQKVSLPLVLHGASGTPIEKIRECIGNGICKINVNTEISRAALGYLEAKFVEQPVKLHFSEISYGCSNILKEQMCSFVKAFSL